PPTHNPPARAATTELHNLAYACQGCNSHKYNHTTGIDPVSGDVAPLHHPRQQIWSKQFTWNEDCSKILGITAVGRTTVIRLHLNRLGLVNLRKILYASGEHPPSFKDR
ncbi:MAG: HNH endonuclease, partial [Cyanobacteria bacterium P01_D01_bin.14]